jgi:hypothetical protein
MVLSKKIEVRESKIAGHGLYAKERIEVGEMVSVYIYTIHYTYIDPPCTRKTKRSRNNPTQKIGLHFINEYE